MFFGDVASSLVFLNDNTKGFRKNLKRKSKIKARRVSSFLFF